MNAQSQSGERYWRAHLELIDRGGIVLTATRRQARALARVYAARAEAAGRHVWDAPRTSALSDWLGERWRQGDGKSALLDEMQALHLWRAELEDTVLLDTRAAARAARAAYAVARDYELDWSRTPPTTQEQRSYYAWSRRFQAQCRQRERLDHADLAAALLDAPPERTGMIGLHGFERLSPALRRLLERWALLGVESVDLTPREPTARVWRAAPESTESELETIGHWCLEQLALNPGARLAVLIPDLAARESTIERLLAEYLQPSLLRPGAEEGRLYASARSPSLASYSVIDTALSILSLAKPQMGLAEFGRLLRSPYVGAADTESHHRARCDATLRKQHHAWVDPRALVERLAAGTASCPRLAQIIHGVRAELANVSRRGPSAWSAAMARALHAAGWPAGRPLRSSEFEAAEKFSELLSTLAGLEAVGGPLSFEAAHEELAALAAATPFQPDSGEPSVVVFDGFTDLGYALDGLYVAGLSAERLPEPVAPDPFLPADWQREHGLPHASAAVELARAQSLVRSWGACAQEIVLSCPVRDDDGVVSPSSLIGELREWSACELKPTRAAQIRAAARLTAWRDLALPELEPEAPLPGGVRLLELQSACPFHAGAELRLHAQPLARRGTGIDRMTRGQLLHAACAALWRELRDRDGLIAAGSEGRMAAIRNAVDSALRSSGSRRQAGAFDEVERGVLTRRLRALLEVDMGRPPFRVADVEAPKEFVLADRRLKVRIDRIDELEDGSTIVIDYKSSRASKPKRWTGSHPDRPQVAAYAALLDPTPVAAAYLYLGNDPPQFFGLAAASGTLANVRAPHEYSHAALAGRSWDSVIDEWRKITNALARAFAAGVTVVDPTPEACRYCELEGLCRVQRPTPPQPEPAIDEEGEDDVP